MSSQDICTAIENLQRTQGHATTYTDFAVWMTEQSRPTVGMACRRFPDTPLDRLLAWWNQWKAAVAATTGQFGVGK